MLEFRVHLVVEQPSSEEDAVLEKLKKLEELIMAQNESIQALKAAAAEQNAALNAALDQMAQAQANIAADEQTILAKLNTLGDLTPENQAIVDQVVADFKAVATKSQAQAKAFQDLADSIPETPVV